MLAYFKLIKQSLKAANTQIQPITPLNLHNTRASGGTFFMILVTSEGLTSQLLQ